MHCTHRWFLNKQDINQQAFLSHLCSAHGVDEICKFLCILFLVISGYSEVIPPCPINARGLQRVIWTLLWAILTPKSAAPEEDEMAQNKPPLLTSFTLNTEPDGTLRCPPPSPSWCLTMFPGLQRSFPACTSRMVATNIPSLGFVPCSSQDGRTAKKQLLMVKTPPGP